MSFSLILGVVLAVPALLIQLMVAPLVALCALPALALLVFRKKPSKDAVSSDTAGHVIITGASSGIGLSVAQESVKRGVDRVTLLARNIEKLNQAKAVLEKESSRTQIDVVSVDVTDAKAVKDAAKKICPEQDDKKTPTYLFCCAGSSVPGHFLEKDPEVFAKTAELNLLGTIYSVHAFLPHLKRGTIVLTSSMGGQFGIFGYTSYSPTKAALKGFAESLHMELINSDVNIQVSYPPDTDTPGYQEENKTKPKETFAISDTAGLFKPEDVAKPMLSAAMCTNPKSAVYFGLEGWMLATMTAGMTPESSLIDALCQVSLMGLLRLVSFFYLNDFWNTIRKCGAEKAGSEAKKDYGSISKQDGKQD